MTDRISGLAVVASADFSPLRKGMEQDLPQIVKTGSSRVADELQHLSDKTKTSLNNTFGNLEQHFGSVLDRMAQRLAKGNFSLNTEGTLRGIKDIGEALGDLNLSFTAGKLLDLGEQLRIPQTIADVKELRQEFQQFTSQAQQYQTYLQTFANRPMKDGLSSPLTGMTKYLAETHGEFNQRSLQSSEQAYEDAVYSHFVPTTISGTNKTSVKDLALAAKKLREIETNARYTTTESASEVQGYALREDTYKLGPTPQKPQYTTTPDTNAMRRDEIRQRQASLQARRDDLLVAREIRQRNFDAMLMDSSPADEAPTRGRRRRTERIDRQGSHQIRFATQQVGFGIDDAIQSYHYGGFGASVRAASNNATALASTLISDPVKAATAVIAVSAISAVLPIIARGLNAEAYQNKDVVTRRFDYDAFNNQKNIAESVDLVRANNSVLLGGRDTRSELRQALIAGDIGSSLSKQYLKQGSNVRKLSALDEESGDLKNNAAWLEQQRDQFGNMEATAKKAYVANLERQEKLAAERVVLEKEQLAIDKEIGNAKKFVNASLAHSRGLTNFDFATGAMERQGASADTLKKRIMERAAEERKFIWAFAAPEDRAGLLAGVEGRLQQQLNDPEGMARRVAISQIEVANNRRSFNNTYGGYGQVDALHTKFANLTSSINGEVIQGSLSRKEGDRRIALAGSSFGRDRFRALEDEMEADNPEINPLSRLDKSLTRRMQDLNLEKNLTDDERRRVGISILTGAERAKSRILDPSGTRRFSAGEAIDVNSAQDSELRSRMTQSFEWQKSQADHSQKTMEEVRDAIVELQRQLKVDAERLGRK